MTPCVNAVTVPDISSISSQDKTVEQEGRERTHTCARSEESGYFSGTPSPYLSSNISDCDATPQRPPPSASPHLTVPAQDRARPISPRDVPLPASPLDASFPSNESSGQHRLKPLVNVLLPKRKASIPANLRLALREDSRKLLSEVSDRARADVRRLRSMLHFEKADGRPTGTSFLDI